MPDEDRPATPGGDRLVVAIGAFKLLKCALLGGLAAVWLSGVAGDGSLFETAAWLGALDGHRIIRRAFLKLASLDARALRDLAIASLAYAAVFAVEGVGLIMRRRWAEWLTVFVTASFVPFEVYELVRRPGPGKLVALAINVAIVVYLARRRLAARMQQRAAARAGGDSRFRPA
jgi:uncharacterized membrane protein (DUF2068 family)